jgi:ABC-2 type transport system permease protein
MKKIRFIILREYLTRVKKRSFIVMTILGPLLMASIWIIPYYLTTLDDDLKIISVLDQSGLYVNKIPADDNLKFVPANANLEEAKANMIANDYYALLYIPLPQVNLPSSAILYSDGQLSLDVKNYIRNTMKRILEDEKLRLEGIDSEVLQSIKTNIYVSSITIDGSGNEKESSEEIKMVIGLFSAILIYFFIFLFGSQVMRGVIEEKTSRVVEIIVSSVKPFQLMMGKIIGIALVGLTQFLLWVVLTTVLVTSFQIAYSDEFNKVKPMPSYSSEGLFPEQGELQEEAVAFDNESANFMIKSLLSINFPLIIGAFIFFFLGGYLLYAALFAAIGSAVDSEADTQQFMFPVTIPLILSIVMAQFIINDPGGQVAFWFSIFPLTSPIIMMIRIPYGVQEWELLLSGVLLIAGFVVATWMAGRIYRTGILMYGKKVNYKELWKWFFYSS